MRVSRSLSVVLLCLATFSPTLASADVDNGSALNVQEGDNDGGQDQSGESQSGDSNAGQVTGVVASGDASVDATNRSEDVSLESGDASGANSASAFTGLNATGTITVATDVTNARAYNVQEGDNASQITQAASAVSGDGVGGQVIGVVTASGGSADIVAANTSADIDVTTGDAFGENDAAALTGHHDIATATVSVADIFGDISGDGFLIGVVHEGDNDTAVDQSAAGASGDGVGGQVLGVVSAGDTSLDATNASEDVDITTGDGDASNDVAAFVGSTIGPNTDVLVSDIVVGETFNAQEGDNAGEFVQAADASSGDGVGGQVVGVVTSATGSADIVAANTSEDVDMVTGDTESENEASAFVGQQGLPVGDLTIADIVVDNFATNIQEGDNDLLVAQSAASSSGDGVAGQVLGVVSAGDTSLDATNRSQDVDVTTGDGFAANDVAAFVGQATASDTVVATDIDNGVFAFNLQEGDNTAELIQAAAATSGDGVAGQIGGVVTSAGGSADLVLANTSVDSDLTTGDGDHENIATAFIGQNRAGTVSVF